MNPYDIPDDPYRTASPGDLPDDYERDTYRRGDDPGDDELAGYEPWSGQ